MNLCRDINTKQKYIKDIEHIKNIENLECDIIKINEMFNELQILIHDQHQNLDNIIDHIDIIHTDVITTNIELKNA